MVWGWVSEVARQSFGGRDYRWLGLGLGDTVSSPNSGVIDPVGFFIYFLNISLARVKPVSAPSQAPALPMHNVILRTGRAFTLRRRQFVDSLHMDISPNCTTRFGLGSTRRI